MKKAYLKRKQLTDETIIFSKCSHSSCDLLRVTNDWCTSLTDQQLTGIRAASFDFSSAVWTAQNVQLVFACFESQTLNLDVFEIFV